MGQTNPAASSIEPAKKGRVRCADASPIGAMDGYDWQAHFRSPSGPTSTNSTPAVNLDQAITLIYYKFLYRKERGAVVGGRIGYPVK